MYHPIIVSCFLQLPDINAQINDLDDILENTDWDAISKGREKLQNIQREIRRAVKNNTDIAYEKIEEAGKSNFL